jgi:HEAT repeats
VFVSPLDAVYDNGGVTEADPAEVVRHLLAAAGTPGYGAYLAEFERLGEAGCDLLFALYVSSECLPDLPRVPRPHPVILNALGEVDRPAAREMLVAAANERRAGHAFHRECAMRSLIKLGDPRVPDLLVRLVKDRDSSVRFAAVKAAVELGDARVMPALRRLAQASRTPPGTRAGALDAIKAIIARENADHV